MTIVSNEEALTLGNGNYLVNTPMLWINAYLQEKIAYYTTSRRNVIVGYETQNVNGVDEFVLDGYGNKIPVYSTNRDYVESPGIGVPFFPASPNTIDDLTETWVTIGSNQYPYAGVRCTYDRLTRLRRKPFPHIKGEQLLYYYFATAEGVTDKMIAVTELTLRLMDREDETAEDINRWAVGKTIGGFTNQFYFHRFRVYQLEEVADLIDFGTARTYGGNKIIIEYEYHQADALTHNTII